MYDINEMRWHNNERGKSGDFASCCSGLRRLPTSKLSRTMEIDQLHFFLAGSLAKMILLAGFSLLHLMCPQPRVRLLYKAQILPPVGLVRAVKRRAVRFSHICVETCVAVF